MTKVALCTVLSFTHTGILCLVFELFFKSGAPPMAWMVNAMCDLE